MESSIYWTSTIILASLSWLLLLYLRCRHQNLPPGPTGLPILGSLPFLHPELHTHFFTLSKTYGPIYRLFLGSKLAIIISSPSLAREVLRDNDTVLANRDVPSAARVIAYGGSDIVWTPAGPVWRMLRRVCVQRMLSPVTLDSVYHLRRREVRSTVGRLRQSPGKPVDVGALVFLSVINVITSMLWGGTVDAEEGMGVEFRELIGEITQLLGKPNLSDFFPWMERFDLQGIQRKMKGLLGRFDKIFARIIEERTEGGKKEGAKDMLEFMLKLQEEEVEGNVAFTMTHVKALLMDMVVGGTDTTSNTVEWAMAEVMNKPYILKKAQEELEQVVGKINIVEESHLSKLHYLHNVIKEVLRLHPALPLMVPHCPNKSCTIGGYTIPEGSRVFVNVWAIHHDPSIWQNPWEFRPERFEDMSRKWDFSGNDFSYLPFGSGRRICAGIAMAERMSLYTLASLLHSFEWKLPEGREVDLAEKFGIVMKKAEPLIAIPTPRLDGLHLYS